MKYNQLLFKPIYSNTTSNRQQFCSSSNNSLTFNTHIKKIKKLNKNKNKKSTRLSMYQEAMKNKKNISPSNQPYKYLQTYDRIQEFLSCQGIFMGTQQCRKKEILLPYNIEHNIGNSLSYTDCYKSYAYPRKI